MVIDTNIIIACLDAEPKAVKTLSEWKLEGRAIFISVISIAETLAIPSLTEMDISKIKEFLKNFISIQLDDLIAETSGFIRRKYRLEIPDAIIAATALAHRLPLVTRDRQFRKISEIAVIEI